MGEKTMHLDANRHYINRILAHELGHWTVARQLGVVVGEITLKFETTRHDLIINAHTCATRVVPEQILHNTDEVFDYLMRRAAILLGGAIYEVIWDKGVITDSAIEAVLNGGGADDQGKLNELLMLASCLQRSGQIHNGVEDFIGIRQAKREEAFEQARLAIVNNYDFVETVMEASQDQEYIIGDMYEISPEGLNFVWENRTAPRQDVSEKVRWEAVGPERQGAS